MLNAMETARRAARKAQENTYEGMATVVEYHKVADEITRLTRYEETIVLEGQPCKLSFSKITPTIQEEAAAKTGQEIKLFISPDISIKPGSKITITQNGITADYTYSGIPAVYATHQEYILEAFRGWA